MAHQPVFRYYTVKETKENIKYIIYLKNTYVTNLKYGILKTTENNISKLTSRKLTELYKYLVINSQAYCILKEALWRPTDGKIRKRP